MSTFSSRATGPSPFSRRRFLTLGAGLAVASLAPLPVLTRRGLGAGADEDVDDMVIETVRGPVRGAEVHKALCHEHLYVDFHGPADSAYMDVDWAEVRGAIVASLREVKAQDVNLYIDWTGPGVGRNILLLRDAARASNVNIVSPTGIYKGLMPPAYVGMTVEQMATRFIEELTRGCDGTAVRAGWIKIATTEQGSTDAEISVHRAAAIAARETGCTISLHSPLAATTRSVVKTLTYEGFDLQRFVWGHAQLSATADHIALASEGATVQFDAFGIRHDPFFTGAADDTSMLDAVVAMVKAGHGERVLVSIDASVYVNPPKWQYDRDNTYLYRDFETKLRERIGEEATRMILRDNVIRSFRRGDNVT